MSAHEQTAAAGPESTMAGRPPEHAVHRGAPATEVDGLLHGPRSECPADLSALRYQSPDVLSVVAPIPAARPDDAGSALPPAATPTSAHLVAGACGRRPDAPPAVPPVGQRQARHPPPPRRVDGVHVDGRPDPDAPAPPGAARRTAPPPSLGAQGPAAPAVRDPQA